MLSYHPHSGIDNIDFASSRTEDARFSPSGKFLILARKESLILLEVESALSPTHIIRHTDLRSTNLAFPHGIDFLTEDVIAVANRDSLVSFFRLRPSNDPQNWMELEFLSELDSEFLGPRGCRRLSFGREIRGGPGSVRVHKDHMYICANFENTISKYKFSVEDYTVKVSEGILVANDDLEVLDGIAVSRDGEWIAVADAGNFRVVVFRSEDYSRSCVLSDPELSSPHGLCFDPKNRFLYVSDAGERDLHVFESVDGKWETSMKKSAFSCRGIVEEAFVKTKESVPEEFRPLVGGIKGLDIDESGRFIIGTCLNQLLCFFDTRSNYIRNIDDVVAPSESAI